MYCQGYATIRVELHSHISNKDALYANLSDNERTNYLLRAVNIVTSNIIDFLFHKFVLRYGQQMNACLKKN